MSYTTIQSAPNVPALGSETFEEDMRAFHNWEKTELAPKTNQIRQEVEGLRDETADIKNETESIKNIAQQYRDDTLNYKNQTEALHDEVVNISAANFNYKGDWSSSTTYSLGDSVSYAGYLWISTQANNTGNTPSPTSSYWTVYYGKVGMTKSEFEALAALRREKYAGSGFIEWGLMHPTSGTWIQNGMWVRFVPGVTDWNTSATNVSTISLGRKLTDGFGKNISKTVYPVVNTNGYLIRLDAGYPWFYEGLVDGGCVDILLPSPPTSLGTITDSTSLPFGMKQGDFAILNDTGRELCVGDDSTFTSGLGNWIQQSGILEWDSTNQRAKITCSGLNVTTYTFGRISNPNVYLIKGIKYKLIIDVSTDSDLNSMYLGVGSKAYVGISTKGVGQQFEFIPKESGSIWFNFYSVSENGIIYIDNISIKQVSEQPIVALQDVSSGIDIYQNTNKFEARDSISRRDLVFLESWHEDVSEKDVVYPYGNVQYRGGDVDGLSGISDANWFTGYDTYSLFGNWQNAGDLVGKGYRWSQLSEADKQKLLANEEHNLYIDGDKVIQVRDRVRSIKGLGNEWAHVLPWESDEYHNILGYISTNTSNVKGIAPKGSLTYVNDYGATPSSMFGVYKTNTVVDRSIYHSLKYSSGWIDDDEVVYALPIALVQRRNLGAYHPVYNPEGCAKFLNTDGTTQAYWYETDQTVTSIIDCFDPSKITGGTIASGISGRPDGLYADEVNERDVKDLRMSAHERPFKEIHNDYRNKAIAGEIRGEERLYKIKKFTGSEHKFKIKITSNYSDVWKYPAVNGDQIWLIDSYDTNLPFVENVTNFFKSNNYIYIIMKKISTGEIFFLARDNNYITYSPPPATFPLRLFKSPVDIASNNFTYTTFTSYDDFEFYDLTSNKSYTYNNTMTWCDIIGDSRKLDDRVKYVVDTSVSQTVDLLKNDYVKVTSDGGTTYTYYRSLLDRAAVDLSTDDYTNTTNWVNLGTNGTIGGYPQEWLDNGIAGVPLVVGEEGESLLPVDVTINTDYQAYKLSRKNLSIYKVLVKKKDGTWQEYTSGDPTTTANTYSVDTAHNLIKINTTDSYSGLGYSSEQEMLDLMKVLVFYETKTNFLELADNNILYDLGYVTFVNDYTINYGALTVFNTINKVPIAGGGSPTVNSVPLTGWHYRSDVDLLSTNTERIPIHETIRMNAGDIPTAKFFTYLTKQNNIAYLQFVFKEMKYDTTSGTWGDDNKFQIVDKVSTTTDNNGLTILYGQKRCKIPYFIVDKD